MCEIMKYLFQASFHLFDSMSSESYCHSSYWSNRTSTVLIGVNCFDNYWMHCCGVLTGG